MEKQREMRIRSELDNLTGLFCSTFHACADEYLANPSKIPNRFSKKNAESKFITRKCMKKVFGKVIDKVF